MSTNGLLSFEAPFTEHRVCTLPCTTVPIIAPIWVDLIFTRSGFIYYRTTQDSAVLNKVAEMIAGVNPGLSDYQPTLAIIVTWFEAPLRNQPVCFRNLPLI